MYYFLHFLTFFSFSQHGISQFSKNGGLKFIVHNKCSECWMYIYGATLHFSEKIKDSNIKLSLWLCLYIVHYYQETKVVIFWKDSFTLLMLYSKLICQVSNNSIICLNDQMCGNMCASEKVSSVMNLSIKKRMVMDCVKVV